MRGVMARIPGWVSSGVILAVLAGVGLWSEPAAAQGKPDFAGKPASASKAKEEMEEGTRHRREEAREHAKERGEGKKKGLEKADDDIHKKDKKDKKDKDDKDDKDDNSRD